MSWTAKIIETDSVGTVNSETAYSDILGDFNLEQTLGDEMHLKAGDISLEHRSALNYCTFNIGDPYYWLAMYYESVCVDVFRIDRPYAEKDLKKSNRFKSRLSSLQKIVWEDLSRAVINFDSDPEDYSYNANNAAVDIDTVSIRYSTGVYGSTANRYGFDLAELVRRLGGSGANFYNINSINILADVPEWTDTDNRPILWRGESLYVPSYTAYEAMDFTFGDHNITWKDVLSWLVFAYNLFVVVVPSIGTKLQVELQFYPKSGYSGVAGSTPSWRELKLHDQKFRLDGVKIQSGVQSYSGQPSFIYTQGSQSGKVYEREVPIADVDEKHAGNEDVLYWAAGANAGSSVDILDGSGDNRPFFSEGLVETRYDGMIRSGDGIEGEARYNGERAGDIVNADSYVAQLTRVSVNKAGFAQMEGVVL